MSKWIGLHHWSTYMILVSLILSATAAHPTLMTWMMLLINAPLLFVMREVARYEGHSMPVCKKCLFASVAILAVASVAFFNFRFIVL